MSTGAFEGGWDDPQQQQSSEQAPIPEGTYPVIIRPGKFFDRNGDMGAAVSIPLYFPKYNRRENMRFGEKSPRWMITKAMRQLHGESTKVNEKTLPTLVETIPVTEAMVEVKHNGKYVNYRILSITSQEKAKTKNAGDDLPF